MWHGQIQGFYQFLKFDTDKTQLVIGPLYHSRTNLFHFLICYIFIHSSVPHLTLQGFEIPYKNYMCVIHMQPALFCPLPALSHVQRNKHTRENNSDIYFNSQETSKRVVSSIWWNFFWNPLSPSELLHGCWLFHQTPSFFLTLNFMLLVV